jgi:hypothetical protein
MTAVMDRKLRTILVRIGIFVLLLLLAPFLIPVAFDIPRAGRLQSASFIFDERAIAELFVHAGIGAVGTDVSRLEKLQSAHRQC